MVGWIKIHRRLTGWEWYKDSKMVHLFIHLLLKANRKPGRWKGVDIKRGQVVTGRKQLSRETGISERSIRTFIKRLKTTSELTTKTTNKFSIITICNYDSYQTKEIENDQHNDQPTANKRPASDHKQEGREGKEERKGFPSPEMITEYAKENGYDLDGTYIFEYYKDFDFKDSQGNEIKNWKNKVRKVWFKPEHKINSTSSVKANIYVPPN